MKLTFCGAARVVTGSCHLVEMKGSKVLVDCGMFQGPKAITRLNYEDFAFDPADIDYVFLTHAHIDHSGLLPKLVKQGFGGYIVSTSATVDLCKVMLEDSADRHEKDTEDENRRRARKGLPPREPLYTRQDAKRACKYFKRICYDELCEFGDVKVRYRDAGHILGSAIIEMFAEDRKIVFSGDLGEWGSPIVRDPTIIEDADYLLIESTYGDRLHEGFGMREDLLSRYAEETHKKGGKLMIPSFAVERTQELLYAIKRLLKSGGFPRQKVFLDSPLAMRATDVFKKHRECYDEEISKVKDPFGFKNLEYTPKVRDSMRINTYGMPCAVIAGSGMCTGGRIRHHLRHGIWDPKNTLLFVGYQAEGTLGRVVLEGAKRIRMMGLELEVKSDIRSIEGFSAHSDCKGLVKWAKGFVKKPKTFIVHGELDAAESLKRKLEKEGFRCSIPSLRQTVELK